VSFQKSETVYADVQLTARYISSLFGMLRAGQTDSGYPKTQNIIHLLYSKKRILIKKISQSFVPNVIAVASKKYATNLLERGG
jgi:hypothetical protein